AAAQGQQFGQIQLLRAETLQVQGAGQVPEQGRRFGLFLLQFAVDSSQVGAAELQRGQRHHSGFQRNGVVHSDVLTAQRKMVEGDVIQPFAQYPAQVVVVIGIRRGQHIAVMLTKALQRLLLVKIQALRQGKHFAAALILVGAVGHVAIHKGRGRKVKPLLYKGQGAGKQMLIGVDGLQKIGTRLIKRAHGFILLQKQQPARLTSAPGSVRPECRVLCGVLFKYTVFASQVNGRQRMAQVLPRRSVLHIDCDCFFASVEMRDNPALRDIPIAIGGRADQRGVIATCNYPARRFGVRSAMATAQALKLCPSLLLVPGRMALYREVSQQLMTLLQEYAVQLEQVSVDEAYLEIDPTLDAAVLAQQIRARVKQQLGISVSVGIAPNKFLAKIASDWNKPDGQFEVLPAQLDAFVAALPLVRIPGIGPAQDKRLALYKL